jgi:hypothetical protein
MRSTSCFAPHPRTRLTRNSSCLPCEVYHLINVDLVSAIGCPASHHAQWSYPPKLSFMQGITKSFVCVLFGAPHGKDGDTRHPSRTPGPLTSHSLHFPVTSALIVTRSRRVRIGNTITRTPQPLSYDAAPGRCICLSAGLAPFPALHFCLTVNVRKCLLLGPRGSCFCRRTKRER